jgi:hypothetical protein
MTDLDSQLRIAADAFERRAANIVYDADILGLLDRHGSDPRALTLGAALLDAHWHDGHEALGERMQWLRAPELVDAFYRASLKTYTYHYDGGNAIRRRFTWALADVGNQAAFDALIRLCGSCNRQTAVFAFKRLRGWIGEQPRKRFAYSPRLD